MIKVEIKETFFIEKRETFTDIYTFKNENDLKEFLLNYKFEKDYCLDEYDIEYLLENNVFSDEKDDIYLKILEKN